jgi:hypothetical protein
VAGALRAADSCDGLTPAVVRVSPTDVAMVCRARATPGGGYLVYPIAAARRVYTRSDASRADPDPWVQAPGPDREGHPGIPSAALRWRKGLEPSSAAPAKRWRRSVGRSPRVVGIVAGVVLCPESVAVLGGGGAVVLGLHAVEGGVAPGLQVVEVGAVLGGECGEAGLPVALDGDLVTLVGVRVSFVGDIIRSSADAARSANAASSLVTSASRALKSSSRSAAMR